MDRRKGMSVNAKKCAEEEIEKNNRLEISTFGHFVVKRGDKILTEGAGRSYKVWKLFKFLLSYHGKTTEELMENFYPEEEPGDPERTLRNLVYRLRRLLAAGVAPESDPKYIVLTQGLYYFNSSSNYWLDAEEFKKLCSEADRCTFGDPDRAVGLYHQALSLYNGFYLPESLYDDWVIPVRNYYHRLYLENVYKQAGLLKRAGRYQELRNMCEKVFLIEPFQEDLHVIFMEALLEGGRVELARTHYNYVSTLLYRQNGFTPSDAMRALYKRITSEKKAVAAERNIPLGRLNEHEEEGAFFCSPQTFMMLYRLEEARAERSRQAVFWGCLGLFYPANTVPDVQKKGGEMEFLEEVLRKNLRRGDVVCRWDENHYYVMLPCLTSEQSAKTLGRIKEHFFDFQSSKGVILQSTCRPIQGCRENFSRLKTFA